MFGLRYDTPEAWVGKVEKLGLMDLLSDHAHCELKAAATMQALVAKNPDQPSIIQQLPRVAMEELEHFELVERTLRERGGQLQEQSTSPYADGLQRGSAPTRNSLLLDKLVISHLIEARSAERFHLLAHHLSDSSLATLYGDLMPSESAHRVMFLRLASGIFAEAIAEKRLGELRDLEAAVIQSLPLEARIHSGPG